MSADPPSAVRGPIGSTPSVEVPPLTSEAGAADDPSATAPLDETDGDHASDHGAAPTAVGTRFGRYTLLAELGQGGMGVVFKAWDPVLDRPVALKVLHAGRLAGERSTRRFLNEARAVARLDHPHIVEIHDMGLLEGAPYFTMALVDGPDLMRWLRARQGPLDGRHLCRLLAPVARALDHAHRAGIIHRDVKPANIIVGDDGAARLVDFGVARLVDTDLTRTGQVVGTPAFMAPEQARGESDIDRRVDVYGLGGVLYWAVTGAVPPRGRSRASMGVERAGVDRDLAAICLAALAPERGDRYPDCASLAADLERYARREPVAAAHPGLGRRLRWWLRRRRVAVFTIGGLALGLAGGQALLGALDERRREAARIESERAADARLTRAAEEIAALRARGQTADADALREQVVRRLDVQGTAALARFHLAEGEQALAAGRAEAADAFAAAYAQRADRPLRIRALVGLGEHHRRRGEAGSLAAVLDAADALEALDTPDFGPLRREHALFAHDLRAAARWSPPPSAAVLRALVASTPTSLPRERSPRTAGQPLAWVDLPPGLLPDAPAGPLIRVGFDLVAPTVELPVVGALPEPPDGRWVHPPRVARDPAGRALLFGVVRPVGDGQPRAALYRWVGAAPLQRLWSDPAIERLGPTIQLDLDGDGRAPIWFAPPWTLHALAPVDGDRWALTTPDSRLPRAGSIIYGLRGVTTAEGPALAVAAGEWRAYDVRLLRPDPDESRLALHGRRKLGHVTGLAAAAGDDLWVLTDGESLNRRMFRTPPETPTLHRIDAARDGLPVRRAIRLTAPFTAGNHAPRLARPAAEGPPVVVLEHRGRPRGGVLVVAPDAEAEIVGLPGLTPLLVADLDRDGDDELLVRADDDAPVMVLGAGTRALPVADLAAHVEGVGSQTPPATGEAGTGDTRDAVDTGEPVDPAAAEAIDALVALGRLRAARDQLRLRAELGHAPIRARLRAGRLSLRIDDPAGAAADFEEAAASADGEVAHAAWRWAADAHRRLRQPDAERAALTALAALTPADARAPIEARIATLSARGTHRVDFARPLDAAWRLALPDRIRRDGRSGRLMVEARMTDGALASLRLAPSAGQVEVAGTLALRRGEFSSVLVIGLTRRGATADPQRWTRPEAALLIGVGRTPGGQAIILRASSGPRQHHFTSPPGEGVVQVPATPFRVVLDGSAGEAFVEWGSGVEARRATLSLPRFEGPMEAIELTLGTRRLPGGGDGALRAALGPLTISGAAPATDPMGESPSEAVRRALAEEQLEAAATLAERSAVSAVDRAAAWDAAGRIEAADGALRAATDPAARDRLLAGWMHRRPGETFARISRLWSLDEAVRIFLMAWGMPLDAHPRDAEVREALAAIEARFDPSAVSPENATALLGRMAESAAVLGRIRRARRAFDALLGLVPAEAEPIVEDRIVGWMLRRAQLEAEHGSPRAARAWLERAVQRSGVPELVTDHIRASAVLAPLMGGAASDGEPREEAR